jgi:hypothetical protein
VDFSGFNIWELLVAPIPTFIIGFFWYGKPLFGNIWQRMVQLSDEDVQKGNMLLIFGVSYLLNFIIAFFLSAFIEISMMLGSNAVLGGIFASILCLGFVGTSLGINYLFARKPLKLYLVDVGYFAVSFFTMGFIIGAWY